MGAIVYLIDDDHSFRTALCRLLRGADFLVEAYPSASEFLKEKRPRDVAGCVVLDVDMPGMNGLALQEQLAGNRSTLPIIFLTANGDKAARALAIGSGAADFLTKPVSKDILVAAIKRAMETPRYAG
ncbi:response regulator transcription factor [Labrys okinawensis]|uniref:response regulator transcription factor n=1 Tax=Labrys okinawensis TaxID=346911 RepID=UPI0039BC80AE